MKMKKLFIAAMAFVSVMAQATPQLDVGKPYVGVRAAHNFEVNINPVGLTLGSKWGKFGAEASFDRSTGGSVNVNQWGLVGSYDLITYEKITVDAKLGGVYVDPSVGYSGWQGVYGIGASYPVAKNTVLTTSYFYQNGDRAVDAYNGGSLNVGVKYSF